jgi:HPt (histidine-containing phosphotransfer) domain-containing protein
MDDRAQSATGGSPAVAPAAIDAVTIERLVEAIGEHGVARAVDIYVAAADTARRKVEEALDRRDLVALAAVAHTIKSSSRLLGATRLSLLAARVECQAREGDATVFAGAGELLPAQQESCDALRAVVATGPFPR